MLLTVQTLLKEFEKKYAANKKFAEFCTHVRASQDVRLVLVGKSRFCGHLQGLAYEDCLLEIEYPNHRLVDPPCYRTVNLESSLDRLQGEKADVLIEKILGKGIQLRGVPEFLSNLQTQPL